MYADGLILVTASVNLLPRMIDTCGEEAVYLHINFNALKSNIIRYGPRCTDWLVDWARLNVPPNTL